MFATIKHRIRDAATVARLSEEAESLARSFGSNSPGSEHYVLAALTLPDRTALRVFHNLGLTGEAFSSGMRAQYITSLEHAGLASSPTTSSPSCTAALVGPKPKLFTAAASGQALMQRVAASAVTRRSRPLLGADVLLAAADEEFSITARALRHLGIDPAALGNAAAQVIESRASAPSEA
ncbi:MAG TPA: Clp protease N-terminal domain-containing protein [Azonexus sp.]|nr:Clp protease N-terminal domain-containing protein [Azonexus sp.]